MIRHRVFSPPRSVREYGYSDGALVEDHLTPSTFLLPWEAIDDLADAVAGRRAPAYVVVGEFVRDDGTRYPELGVTTGHIEATSDYRWDPHTRHLRLVCPVCGHKDGKHEKACDRS